MFQKVTLSHMSFKFQYTYLLIKLNHIEDVITLPLFMYERM